ncbi:MAG: FtsW/RodA/SpoVE family cell cycle protein, partial [Elusimicrobia bacterium]|nr:FtsW/RodA/SpoVE family cell cycle protein [Elusimicrobiota bacterium]
MFKEEKGLFNRFIENTDWILVGALIFLIFTGILSVYSAVLHYGNPGRFIATQGAAIGIGVAGMIILLSFNYQNFRQFVYPLYVFSILILVCVLFFGATVRGTKGWFNFGYFSFQPVELAKLIFILVLAGFLDMRSKTIKTVAT